MILRFSLNLILIIAFYPSNAQLNQKEEIKVWSENEQIMWKDFIFKQDSPNGHKAISLVNIKVKGFWDESLPNFIVTATFNRNESWTVDTTSVNLLTHETLHFDIAELYARKIRKGVLGLREQKEKKIDKYNDLISKLLDCFEEQEVLFDKETSHGVYKELQIKWLSRVSKQLKSLDDYGFDEDIF